MLGNGVDLHEIAGRMGISVKTAESDRARIEQKYDVKARAKLIAWAVEWILSGRRAEPKQATSYDDGHAECGDPVSRDGFDHVGPHRAMLPELSLRSPIRLSVDLMSIDFTAEEWNLIVLALRELGIKRLPGHADVPAKADELTERIKAVLRESA